MTSSERVYEYAVKDPKASDWQDVRVGGKLILRVNARTGEGEFIEGKERYVFPLAYRFSLYFARQEPKPCADSEVPCV